MVLQGIRYPDPDGPLDPKAAARRLQGFRSVSRVLATPAAAATLGLTLLLVGCQEPGPPPPPESRVAGVVDTLHGVEIPDPYRWLEDRHSPEVRSWLEEQNAYAELIVGESPLRDRIEDRLWQLMDTDDVGSPRAAGDYEYFTMRRAGEDLPVIYRRAASEADEEIDPEAEYEMVVDPHGRSPESTTRFGIEAFSPDGRYLLYHERDGGLDEVTLRVRDLEEGVDLPDMLPEALYRGVEWAGHGQGFYYSVVDRELGARVRYHELGTDVTDDPVVFGEEYGPSTRIGVSAVAEGRYLLYTASHGWVSTDIHFQEEGGPVRTVVAGEDARFYPRFLRGELYMRTNLGADRNRLLAVNLESPEREHWREVVPEGEHVMEDFTFIGNRIYVTYLVDAANRIAVFEADGTPVGEVPVPELHSASIRAGEDEGEALLTLTSFDKPSTVYRVDLETGERTLHEPPDVEWELDGVVVRQEWRTSSDGTRAPLFIVHHEDIELDGTNPTLLTGYGGFYAARKPSFSTMGAIWLEMGGVFAVATLRGGSEYGEQWHRDGWLENKQNVFDDFISAAEWLIETGYTSPERLAIQGTSNGGLLVGAALTQRPELFRAVVCGFPDVDILRFPFYTESNSPPALLEYGDARIPEHFEAIRRYSPVQNVRDGTEYPAIMLVGGDLDTRVPPEAVLKFTGALQNSTASRHPVILRYHHKAGHSAGRGLPFPRRLADTAMEITFLAQELGVELRAGRSAGAEGEGA